MKTIDVEQGSPEWIAARVGLPTASNFDKVLTPTGKPSGQVARYCAKLTAEWFLGCSLDEAASGFMERGKELEPEAVADYEFCENVDTAKVGLCLLDDGRAGCSPDRLVGDDGLMEIKCPSAEVQMMYLLGEAPTEYVVQVQGQLWITGRKWCDLYCWHPYFPRVIKRYGRDEEFIGSLSRAVYALVARLDAARARLGPARLEYQERLVKAAGDVPAGLSTT